MRLIFATICTTILLITCPALAQSNLVMLISQPGDYIGQGQTDVTTNQSDFSLSGSPAAFSIGAFGYNIYFSGPGGTNLTVGTYSNAARWPFNGSSPGISVFGNGRGCNTVCGNFQIFELHTDGNGNVDRLWVTFTHICECSMAPMTGEIRYNSQTAPSVPVSKTIHVPADYSTIQAAINSASLIAVDTVLVSPGTYNESVNFSGRRVIVTSANGPQSTLIKPPANSSAITFSSGETSNSVLMGFTLTNASTGISVSSAAPTIISNVIINCGAGVNCNFASPSILNNQIVGCSGNAIYLGGAATPVIDGNLIQANHGGVIMFAAGSPLIRNNLFKGNIGDAMNMVNQSDANIIQNVIVNNTGNGIYWLTPSGARGPWVINNTIAKNGAAGIYADGYDASALILNNVILGAPALGVGTFNDNNPPIVQFNDVYSASGLAYSGAISNLTGVAGNISADPLFTCFPGDDYHLLAGSPSIDAGSNAAPQLPGNDIEGNIRIQPGATNGTPKVDQGAYESNFAAPPVPCLYVICPSNIVVTAAPGQNFAIVNYPAPTGTPVATITSSPPSGSVFPSGTNTVTCTATYGTNSIIGTFTITVLVPPTVTNSIPSLSVPAGQTFSLSVTTGGSGPVWYRWTFENTTISGATNATVTVTNAQAINEGAYRAIVTNLVGSATSAVTSVRVLPSIPIIVSNPAPVTAPASSNATFNVTAMGSQPLKYQWYFNNAPLASSNAAFAQYSLSGIQSSNAGNYYVIVSNAVGSATSTVATLTVTGLAPYFIVTPSGGTVGAGSSRTLTGLANGTQPIVYQWLFNSTNLPGATLTNLTLSNLSFSNSGPYQLVASNSVGVSTSAAAQLTVFQSPTLQQGLSNQVVDVGSTVTLTVAAAGSSTLSYAWQLNGSIIPGTNSTLILTNIQASQSGFYRVSITNQYGSTSSIARVSVLMPLSSVVAWGDNSGGQTNVPANLNDIVGVAGGDYHSVALHHDGTLLAWGYNGDGQTSVPTNALRFVSVASGAGHSLTITEKGSVVAWGRNDYGQTNVPATATSNVLAVAAGDAHTIALLSSGTVVAWGDDTYGQVRGAGNLSGIRAIAAGRNHNLALRTNGTVLGWGFNAYGQATPPANLSNVVAIAAGYLHSAALLTNGSVVEWGDNSFGQTNMPAGLTNVIAIAAGDYHTFALRADGTVVGWGDDTYQQTNVPPSLTNALMVVSGNYHGLALVPIPLMLQINNSQLVVMWSGSGTLQWAPTPAGPFTDVGCTGQCFTNLDMSAPAKYFRLRP
jgi:parallel beta-helix repeat protein